MEDIVPEVLSKEEDESEDNEDRQERYERRTERQRIHTRLVLERLGDFERSSL